MAKLIVRAKVRGSELGQSLCCVVTGSDGPCVGKHGVDPDLTVPGHAGHTKCASTSRGTNRFDRRLDHPSKAVSENWGHPTMTVMGIERSEFLPLLPCCGGNPEQETECGSPLFPQGDRHEITTIEFSSETRVPCTGHLQTAAAGACSEVPGTLPCVRRSSSRIRRQKHFANLFHAGRQDTRDA